MRPHMYPHQNNIRERRGGQPPMAPHLMGMPQQRPGVVMSLPSQPVQIMQNHHYTNQNSYSTQGQTNVSSYMTRKQGPSQQSSYNQSNYSNPQVILNKQVINRTKSYRKEYVKDSVNFNGNEPKSHNSFGINEYNPGTLGNFNPSSYNGQHCHPQQHLHRQPHLLQQQKPKLQQQQQPQQQQQQQPQQQQQQQPQQQQQQQPQQQQPQPQPQQQQQQETVPENSEKNEDILLSVKENKETSREEASNNSENSEDCSQIKQNNLFSVKEKTPMCLVNELARFNKISHQYRLTNEQGPAHKKSFTVTLKLDSEEYTAEGSSIKKAQHLAAAEALNKTSFPHPAPKASKNLHPGKLNVTPTVELNALAMKRGEPAIYQLISAPQPQSSVPGHSSYYRRQYTIHRRWNKRGRLNYFFRNGRMPSEQILPENSNFKVSLNVGVWEFFGEGPSLQTARHDAAAKALNHLKKLPVPEDGSTNSLKQDNVPASSPDQDFESNNKSPISLVHEIALKRNMPVQFEVVSEKGPAHMKTFVTKCVVGDITVTGEGNAKKLSKKRAAECMLVELKKLPPISTSLTLSNAVIGRMKRKSNQAKKKSRNLIKIIQDRKSVPEYSEDINPISRLIQIQQVKKEKEPVYTLLEEKGMPRRREFVIEVTVGEFKAIGSGPNKKLAKKAAAQNLLGVMDYPNNEGNPMKNALKSEDGSPNLSKDRKVNVVDSDRSSDNAGGSLGRQVKPGLYLIPNDPNEPCSDSSSTPTPVQTTAVIAKELLNDGNSQTADALVQKASTTKSALLQPVTHTVRPKEQLLYIANLLNFKVQFSDFPKGNHSEYLSLVSMSTDPSHVCHGSGPTIQDSQDQAALTALRALSEMGVDSMTPENPSME